ncbi:ROK family transcriptional regulator [Kitasatospora indigofera]|uniref:ROK family transcriptional regulator n=1 Tax=Kitasatospora indigofera TaxID=67307 RepID=UPI00167E8A0B|nr:ROK family transcriptional regulator [Kitasatospora indigofera]
MNRTGLTGGDPALLRRLNVEAVLRVMRSAEPMTLTQIGRAASLSRQTVDVVIAELDEAGWIEEVAPERSIGRPARRYRFRAEAGHVLGIDVGVAGIRMTLTDLDGAVVASRSAEMAPGISGPDRLTRIHACAAGFLAEHPHARLRALCLGVPAIVDTYGRIRLSTPLPEWSGTDLASIAGTWFDCPAYVENDANLAALAEHWRGAARYADDFIQLIAGKRSGAGMMLGGRLHRGRGGAAGEIGALALLGWEGDAMNDVRASPDPAQIFADAAAGDPSATARVDRFARVLAQGIAAMVLTVNPDLVVIGGGLSQAGEALAGPVRGHLDKLCLDPPQVAASTVGVEAVALGAVRLALEHTNAELFGAHTEGGRKVAGTGAPVTGRSAGQGLFESVRGASD